MKSELNERDQHRRAPLSRRLKVILWDNNGWMFVMYLLFCVAAVTKSTAEGIILNRGSVTGTLLFMLTHACWPPMIWLLACNSAWAPIHYAVWPPTMPDREQLLIRDPITNVAHPTEESKRAKWDKTFAFHEIEYSILSMYALVVFVGSFIY